METKKRRVVVTGMGAITPLGFTAEETWKRVVGGETNVGPVTDFDVTGLPTQIAARVGPYDLLDYFDRRTAERISKRSGAATTFSCIAAAQALRDAKLLDYEEKQEKIKKQFRSRTGIYIGSGGGAPGEVAKAAVDLADPNRKKDLFDFAQTFKEKHYTAVLRILSDSVAARPSIIFGAEGGIASSTQACATGAGNIELAYRELSDPESDNNIIVAGGTDAIDEIVFWVFAVVGATTKRNHDPLHASRPFDRERDGFVMAEGAAVLVLEELSSALRRGAPIYAEIIGAGKTSDAKGDIDPEPETQALAIKRTLKQARIRPDFIDYINAHGTSTPRGDARETTAIKMVFGEWARRVAISSTKSTTGHLLGAAGSLESIFCILAIRDSIIPPTINYQHYDPECDLNITPNIPTKKQIIRIALNLSFGFFGQNVCLAFQQYEK